MQIKLHDETKRWAEREAASKGLGLSPWIRSQIVQLEREATKGVAA